MCGIVGIYSRDRGVDPATVREMTALLTHRGPLDEGYLVAPNVMLGMRRLSIIDIEGGHQPVFNEDGSIAVILNGEIYNYRELGHTLRARGHRFATASDTEVLVHLYEEMGEEMFSELNGMFGLALWDARRERLVLARDRLGVKPLYYHADPEWLAFASELKALLLCPFISRDLDLEALSEYLTLMYIRAPRTPFRSVRKLLPGHYLVAHGREVRIERYWDLRAHCVPEPVREADVVDELRALLSDAVRLRLRSDVPVGIFLSGGIDSSTVASFAARHQPTPVDTFAVGFVGGEFDELGYARAVAKAFRTCHHETTVTVDDAIRILPTLVWHLDEPNGDSAIVPTYLVSQFAAESHRVVLSGLGGDELFGGYLRYFDGFPVEHVYRLLPGSWRRQLAVWAKLMRGGISTRIAWNALPEDDRYLAEVSYLSPEERYALLPAPSLDGVSFRGAFDAYPAADRTNRLMFVDAQTYLPDEILMLTDRMSMAVSLEVREPLLDFRLVQLAARLPGAVKVDWTRREWKIILKRAMAGILPPEILHRRKWGFGAPVGTWMSEGLGQTVAALFRRSEVVRLGLLNGTMTADHVARWNADLGAQRAAHKLWMLLILEVWARVFLGPHPGHRPTVDLNDLLA